MPNKIHPLADVHTEDIGENTTIWQFCVVLNGAKIGDNCNICSHCLVEEQAVIGNHVTVKSGVQIWNGLIIEDHVFIGPNVTFTNDLLPRSKNPDWVEVKTIIRNNATIGANATILGDIEIGAYSMIGAGSVVTKSTAPHTLWYGNPARHRGFVTKEGVVLDFDYVDVKTGNKYQMQNENLILL